MADNVEDFRVSSSSLARLLVVDDEKPLVAALCRTLSAKGYATAGAHSGGQALALLRATTHEGAAPFDLLITDLMMPDMDGIALLCAAHQVDAQLVGIVMTGHGTIDTAVEAMKNGALDYILKPFNLTVAMPILERALAVRRLRIENAALLQKVAERTTELEAANRQLRSANKELEAFTSSVSHDLRQPLNSLMGFAELLLDEVPGALNATQRNYMTEVRTSADRLLRLTDDLLRFSRLGQQPLRKEPVNVGALVGAVVGTLPDVRADPTLLEQVFVNLLANAFKFTRGVKHPLIHIDGHEQSGECSYTVRDNGVAFDMNKAQGLFTIFHRLHSHKDFEGTGVGLSIVQRIIERHGGHISAQAQVGKGAEFTFTLPA